jgi:hypothetical protein
VPIGGAPWASALPTTFWTSRMRASAATETPRRVEFEDDVGFVGRGAVDKPILQPGLHANCGVPAFAIFPIASISTPQRRLSTNNILGVGIPRHSVRLAILSSPAPCDRPASTYAQTNVALQIFASACSVKALHGAVPIGVCLRRRRGTLRREAGYWRGIANG